MEHVLVENAIATVKGKEWTVQQLLMNASYIKTFVNLEIASIMKVIPTKARTLDKAKKLQCKHR